MLYCLGQGYYISRTHVEWVKADEALEVYVTAVGELGITTLMLAVVRVGGSPFSPTEFRWSYEWPWPRFYSPLDAEEKTLVDDALRVGMAKGKTLPAHRGTVQRESRNLA